MDVLTDVLNSLRLRSSLYCRANLQAPWSLRFEAQPTAVFHVVSRGKAWLRVDGASQPVELQAEDIVVLPRGQAHIISDKPDRPAFASIWLDQYTKDECQLINPQASGEGITTLLCGTFELEQRDSYPLLAWLPDLLHLQQAEGQVTIELQRTLALMAGEADYGQPGYQTLLRRLTDILFIQLIRAWLQQEQTASGWLGALRDQQIGEALSLLHAQPAADWTVEKLARQVAMSRSAFAARFTALVGEPPLQYLLSWRMQLAANLLQQKNLEITYIAEKVGYKSEISFSRAFKKHFKVAPGAYRRQVGRPRQDKLKQVRPVTEPAIAS